MACHFHKNSACSNDTKQYTNFVGPGYYDYYGTVSRDEGLTWTPLFPTGAGSARPTLLRVGKYLLLSGGRHCNSAAGSDVSVWLNADGMATSWEHYSLSYRHNLGEPNASKRFTSGVNTSCRSETSAYTSMSLISATSFAVHYDAPGGKYAINVTIVENSRLDAHEPSASGRGACRRGGRHDGPARRRQRWGAANRRPSTRRTPS